MDRCECRIIHQDRVTGARENSLLDVELAALAAFYKTFSDPTRLKILMALTEQEMCVCDIAAFLDISESGVSHQLRFLRNSGIVENRREGTVLYYRLTDDHVADILQIGLEHIREDRGLNHSDD